MSEATAAHLPVYLTAFIGRDRELREVRRLLAGVRLLTLTGAGGSGKTRLALEVAAAETASFPDGVACVELAPLQDVGRVAEFVAAQLNISDQPGRGPTQALIDALRGRTLLLLLDNCEHVVDGCAALADTLLRACPTLRILATSRAALGIGGETAWLVPPLSLPDPREVTVAAATRAEAVQLFAARARDVRPDFQVTEANLDAVVQICRRLDGIPLALELAAARLRSLSPEQIAQRLDNRFQLLTTGSRTALPRQQTLRATIDWSYDLLDESQRLLLMRLSVFAGDFSLEAAESVCADESLPASSVLDLLSDLVEQSLVELIEHGGTGRYRLLETVAQYAAERLAARGGGDELRHRHARFYRALVETAAPHLSTPQRPPWIAAIDRDFDNIRHALVWTGEHDPGSQLAIAGALCWYWFSSERWSEGRRWLEAALAATAQMDVKRERMAALFAAGVIAGLQVDSAVAQEWLRESTAIAEELGDARQVAYARNYLGLTLVGQPEAAAHLQAAHDWFRAHGDLYGLRLALLLQGTSCLMRGEVADALRLNEEGVRVAREFGLPRELAVALQMLATAVLATGDTARAGALFRESLQALRADPHILFIARGIDMLGVVAVESGVPTEAVRHFAAAAALRERIGASHFLHDRRRVEPRIEHARALLGDEEFEKLWAEGRRRTLDDALAAALEPLPRAAAVRTAVADGGAVSIAAAPGITPAPASAVDVAAALRVRALGPLEIERDGVLLTGADWSHTRPRELLLYLLCHPEGRTREQIGLVFWRDSSAAQVKNSFHVTLHHLRKTLGRPEWIVFENDRYRINGALGLEYDVARFEAGAESALRELRRGRDVTDQLVDALALYRGDFLQDERAGDWHLEPRDRLRQLYVRVLRALGAAHMRAESWSRAADAYQRIVRVDDLDEDAHRNLMTCIARGGERGRALRHYERYVAHLQEEIGADPEPETVALYQRLQRAEAT